MIWHKHTSTGWDIHIKVATMTYVHQDSSWILTYLNVCSMFECWTVSSTLSVIDLTVKFDDSYHHEVTFAEVLVNHIEVIWWPISNKPILFCRWNFSESTNLQNINYKFIFLHLNKSSENHEKYIKMW